jgi:shikimate kinase
MIRLVGPGAAGKTTVGFALAERLGIPFVDLDQRFAARVGDISAYLDAHGYLAYANQNVHVYLETLAATGSETVLALSSGFMTYGNDAHPEYARVRREILASSRTFALLPSFDYDTCVAETVRRQLRRPFSRSIEREEQVIRSRYWIYSGLPVRKFATSHPIDTVVNDLMTYLATGRSA